MNEAANIAPVQWGRQLGSRQEPCCGVFNGRKIIKWSVTVTVGMSVACAVLACSLGSTLTNLDQLGYWQFGFRCLFGTFSAGLFGWGASRIAMGCVDKVFRALDDRQIAQAGNELRLQAMAPGMEVVNEIAPMEASANLQDGVSLSSGEMHTWV